jgi:PQQ-dependent dehydrogenase (methanol/ethanol family)
MLPVHWFAHPRRIAVACVGILATALLSPAAPAPAAPNGSRQADDAEDGQWRMAGKNFANTRFSGLNEINTGNVKDLKVAWTFSIGEDRGQEAAPIVVGSTMYVVGPYPNKVYALDLANSGAMKWSYEPKPSPASQGVACCDTVNRGPVFADGKLVFNTLDAHTIALDANTGRELWNQQVGDINIGETVTMSPLIVKDKVYVGNSGGEFGVRGWLTALSLKDGHIVWRAYSTGPDKDCLIGPDFKPFYAADRAKDLGVSTWPPDQWKIGGGTVWGFVSYDPESNLIFYGTGNPGVWNPEQRPGTTNGVHRSSPAMPTRARRSGRTSSVPTTCTTTTASTKTSCWKCR